MPLVDCIRTDVVTASPDDRVGDVARRLDERNMGSVLIERDGSPVVDDDLRLTGIVTMDDVETILGSEMSCVTDSIRPSSPSAR